MTGRVLWIQEDPDPESVGFQKKNGKSKRN